MKITLNSLINLIFSRDLIKFLFDKLKNYGSLFIQIGWQNAYHDLISVTRRLWFFFFFQIFGALAFVLLSQGKDVLQCLLEDMFSNKIIPTILLIIGIWFWSLASEFGARMLLYLTDSSNDGLDDKRIEFRRKTQRLIPGIQAIFPFLLYILAITLTFKHHYKDEDDLKIIAIFASFIIILLINLKWALKFYFGPSHISNKYFGLEKAFQKDIIGRLGNILIQKKKILTLFPDEINAKMYSDIKNHDNDEIKLSFRKAFPSLFRYCLTFIFTTFCIFILLGIFANEKTYYMIGTPAIMAIGFTCWLITFYSIKIFELVQPFNNKLKFLNLPYSSLLLIWILIVSYSNNDHPISYSEEICCDSKPQYNPKEFFGKWYDYRLNKLTPIDSAIQLDTTYLNKLPITYSFDSTKKQRHILKVPVILIAAEGGALRTGSFTTLLLGGIQDKYPTFKDRIFAYSTVSGGTFGANLFNATVDEKTNLKNDSLLNLYIDYYKNVDFLAPVAAKLFFGEFINYFIPHYFSILDREVALEKAWRNSWHEYLSYSKINLLYNNFYSSTKTDGSKPAIFINSSVVESGNRAIISNVKLEKKYFKDVFDLNDMIHNNISYATAMGLSSRFPLVSPGGKLQIDDLQKIHLVDGGYFENLGNTTLLELLNSITFNSETDSIQIIPYVLQTVFDQSSSQTSNGISFMNEITEITNGMVRTRGGHTRYANIMLKQKINQMGGEYLVLPVAHNCEEIPNNWVLSYYAVEQARTRVLNLINGKGEKEGDELLQFLKQCHVKS